MYLSELGYKFIIDFEGFLRHKNNMRKNTVMKHIERLRKLINLAFKLGWIERDPFVSFKAQFIECKKNM